MNNSAKAIRVLFIYSREDKNLCDGLAKHVRTLAKNSNTPLTLWYDQYIQPGQDWEREFNRHLEEADIVLPLMSAYFFDSSQCQENVETALKKSHEDGIRIIPVILRPVIWKDSQLGHLQALPTNSQPVNDPRWGLDAAFHNVSQGLQKTVTSLLETKKLLGEQSSMLEEDDTITPITLFNQTGSISLFNYLTLPIRDSESDIAHILCIRTIMQICRQNYKVLRGPAPEQEICEEVRRRTGIEYSPQECKKDLTFLIQHGSLISSDDRTKTATSIASFEASIHSKFYQATPDAIAIEDFIEDHVQTNTGTLNKTGLQEIKNNLEVIDRILLKPILSLDDPETLAEKWDLVFRTWQMWHASSLSYLSNLERNAQREQYDIEKYMDHKQIVVRYVQRFARVLLDVARSINELFFNWSPVKRALLIQSISQYNYQHSSAIGSHKEPFNTITDQINKQITDLEIWFRDSAQDFHDQAVTEIQRVVNQAALLALYQRSHINNSTILHDIALCFMNIANVDTAQQVFDATFANALPVHLPEKFTGHARIIEPSEIHSVWDDPPTVRPCFLPIKRGRPGERRTEDPIEEDQQQIQELQAEPIRQERDRQRRFTRLFAQPLLNIGTITSIEPQDRSILEEIIDHCLNDTESHQYQDEDHTDVVIVLLNPEEQAYIRLCSSDGILSIPCYRLKRQ